MNVDTKVQAYKLFNQAINVNIEIEIRNCFDTSGFITAIEYN